MTLLTWIILTFQLSATEPSIAGSAGQYVNRIGNQAAVANRQIADDLFKNALEHERQGWASLNVPLLVQSLQESLDGVKANNQSRELGRATLGAVETGQTGGHLDVKKHGSMSEGELDQFAKSSAKRLPTVKGKLDSWGFKVSYDNKTIKSKFGDFHIDDLNAEVVEKLILDKAQRMGLGGMVTPDKVRKGIKNALKERERITQKAMAQVELDKLKDNSSGNSESTRTQAAVNPADSEANSDTGSTTDKAPLDSAEQNNDNEAEQDSVGDEPGQKYVNTGPQAPQPEDLNTQARVISDKYQRYIELTQKSLGGQGNKPVSAQIGRKGQNIFHMVRERYQSQRLQNKLIENATRFNVTQAPVYQ